MTASSKRPHKTSKGVRRNPKHCASSTTAPRRSHRIAAITRHNQHCLSPDLGPYEYTTINKEASEIRLMTILPGVFGSEVRITVQNHVLTGSQIPVYEALSYAWGSNENPVDIRIEETGGNRMLAVTSNLAEALQYLRYETRPRVLWIDAICIDQQNVPERGHQVSRMADIYRSASPVLIWLGPEFASSDVAMRELSDLGSTVRINWRTQELIPLSGDSYPVWQATPLPFSKQDSVLRSIENLLDRLWFKRLWIWQEVRLAKNRTQILCGVKTMLWETFRNAMWCLAGHESLSDRMNYLTAQISSLSNYGDPQSPVTDILRDTSECLYSDPRDRIYAILNLIYPHEVRDFDTDYSKSTEEVFHSLFLHYTSTSGTLNLLSGCEMRKLKAVKVPSWVPDWTKSRECSPLRRSKACLFSKGEASFDDMGGLTVTACCVGTVDSVHDIGEQDIPSIARRLWRALGQGEDMDVGENSKMDALCHTLCCNGFDELFRPSSQGLPRLQESQAFMSTFLKDDTSPQYRDGNRLDYELSVRYWKRNRAFLTTKEGNIGLAPRRTRIGDRLCIVLGCQSPLVLRAKEVGIYTVVGECYLDEYMDGAGLLGKLPSNWQRVDRHDPDLNGYHDFFMNRDTGIGQLEDPRLGPLPPGWRVADHRYKYIYNYYTNDAAGIFDSKFDPRMSPEALKARGIDLQEYRLV